MFKYLKKNETQESNLYNSILFLSRNELLYTTLNLSDTFQNRINLIFIHISFLFVKIKQKNHASMYKDFYQKMFDYIFRKIEIDMREMGYGDVTVNKNMKFLVKIFYNILLNCEKFKEKTLNSKKIFLNKYLTQNIMKSAHNNVALVDYFSKYQAFCFDLTPDSVLRGDLEFNYNNIFDNGST